MDRPLQVAQDRNHFGGVSNVDMEQDKLVIILADISGYTRFMIENRTSAMHGQLCINSLIEAILNHVDIPLTLQEIEGDAVFLYARHPGSDAGWVSMVREISEKLDTFFQAFIEQLGVMVESTPCPCAICRNGDKLGLKIVVHAGEAVFHRVAGRPQVSGPDVILAHRLLKNSIESNEYLLLTDSAFRIMGGHLQGRFETRQESYEGFDRVELKVRLLEKELLRARDAVYRMSETEREAAVDGYLGWLRRYLRSAVVAQMRSPIRRFSWRDRLLMVLEGLSLRFRLNDAQMKRSIMATQQKRGRRRLEWGPAE